MIKKREGQTRSLQTRGRGRRGGRTEGVGLDELDNSVTEDRGVVVDLLGSGIRSNEGHEMERGEENAAVEGKEMHVAIEINIISGHSLKTVSGGLTTEPVLSTVSELGDVPGEVELIDHTLDALGPSSSEGNGLVEEGISEDVLEGGSHGREGEGVGSEGSSNTRGVNTVTADEALKTSSDLMRETIDGGRDSTSEGLADGEEVRLEVVLLGEASRTSADGVGLVDDEEGAVLLGETAKGLMVTGVGVDDADVGHGRLGQHTCHVVVGQRPLESLHVVELDHLCRLGWVHLFVLFCVLVPFRFSSC